MKYKLKVLPEAEDDIGEAAEFYDKQARGLGDELVHFIDQQFEDLLEFAGIHHRRLGFYCCTVQGRFPYYQIFYKLTNETVVVYAVIDGRRDPRTNLAKLRRRNP